MAFDKVIDSTKLEAGMTATANAIRAKTGSTSPIAWDDETGFKTAVEVISSEGSVVLPDLVNPASPQDMAAGKTLYDDDGNPVSGTLAEIASGAALSAGDNATVAGSASTGIRIKVQRSDGSDYILRSGAYLMAAAPADQFGDATPNQVVKGATFTSAAGYLVEGTHECEGGIERPELTNPATATDMASGKQLIGPDGTIITGALGESGAVAGFVSSGSSMPPSHS